MHFWDKMDIDFSSDWRLPIKGHRSAKFESVLLYLLKWLHFYLFPFALMFPFWMRRQGHLNDLFNCWVARSGSTQCFSVMSNVPFQWKTHNSVEQKFVVKTPSCATNVSDHSSMYGLVVAFVNSVLRLDFLLENELFLRLSCAFVPTFNTTFCTMPSDSRSVSSFSLGLIFESILPTEVVDEAELLLLWHGESSLGKFASSLTCRSAESPLEHGKQTLRKSGLCDGILAAITYAYDIGSACFETLSLPNYFL